MAEPLRITVVSAFPTLFPGPLGESIPGRVLERGLARIENMDLRDYTDDRHRSIDDTPYGGGGGMVLKAEPCVRAMDDLRCRHGEPGRILLTSPGGRLFDHALAVELSLSAHVAFVCGHYKGFDARTAALIGAEEVSIGDFVLSGGELAVMVMIDAVLRLLPGALGNFDSAQGDSFYDGLLEGPIYTRPQSFRGASVPGVLFSGDHEKIQRWRLREALRLTLERRPDLIKRRDLTEEEEKFLAEIEDQMAADVGPEPDQ